MPHAERHQGAGGADDSISSASHGARASSPSTRLAWYAFGPTASIVGEVFGAVGEAETIPEYKIGWRWEPNQHVTLALTYGDEFHGNNGAGVELGAMLFTPQFLCLGGCKE